MITFVFHLEFVNYCKYQQKTSIHNKYNYEQFLLFMIFLSKDMITLKRSKNINFTQHNLIPYTINILSYICGRVYFICFVVNPTWSEDGRTLVYWKWPLRSL